MQTYLGLAIVAACAVPAEFLILSEGRFWALATSEGICSGLVMVGAAGAGLWASEAATASVALALFIPIAQIIYARGLRLVMFGPHRAPPPGMLGHSLVEGIDARARDKAFSYVFLLPGIILPPLAIGLIERIT